MLKKFNTRRPSWIDPNKFLDSNLQNLFDISYFSEDDTLIPNGWHAVQDENRLPSLSSRLPKPKPEPSEMEGQSPATWPASDESGSEGTASTEQNATTRMADESSEEDSEFEKAKVCAA